MTPPATDPAPAAPTPAPVRLVRDRLTFTFYGSFVIWGWLLYSFNPSVPLLGEEFGISDAQAGLHGTAMALGAIVTGMLAPRVVLRTGRRTSLFTAFALIVVGTLVLVLAPSLAWSLPGMFVLSIGGNLAISSAQPGLALHHGPAASAAVTEANGVGSSIGLVGPLAVGACVAIGWGWRPAVAVTAVLALATAVLTSRAAVGGAMTPPGGSTADAEPVPVAAPTDGVAGDGRVLAAADRPHGVEPTVASLEALAVVVPEHEEPAVVRRSTLNGVPGWCFVATIVAAIALENAMTYWSTDLVREQTGAGSGIAAATTAGLVAGMSLIRFVVGPLSLRIQPAWLLAGSFVVAIVGWATLWTATTPAVALAGLFVAGLGFGVQYPLGVSLLLDTAPGAGDSAQARATIAGGIAIGVAPFLLGALADAVGMHSAFLFIPVAAVAGGLTALVGGVALRRAA